jgi:hypothetical protein
MLGWLKKAIRAVIRVLVHHNWLVGGVYTTQITNLDPRECSVPHRRHHHRSVLYSLGGGE